jgi:hypothetical protein
MSEPLELPDSEPKAHPRDGERDDAEKSDASAVHTGKLASGPDQSDADARRNHRRRSSGLYDNGSLEEADRADERANCMRRSISGALTLTAV